MLTNMRSVCTLIIYRLFTHHPINAFHSSSQKSNTTSTGMIGVIRWDPMDTAGSSALENP